MFEELHEHVINGDNDEVVIFIQDVLAKGVEPSSILIVGGAPVTQEFADKIGVDGFAPDAAAAARLASQLVGIASNKKPQGQSNEQSGTGTKSNQSRITRQTAG